MRIIIDARWLLFIVYWTGWIGGKISALAFRVWYWKVFRDVKNCPCQAAHGEGVCEVCIGPNEYLTEKAAKWGLV